MALWSDDLDAEDKNVFIVIGPTCTGKSTLNYAMAGQKMQFIHKKNFKKVSFIKEAHSASFIVPIDAEAAPIDSQLLSHKNAPYTLKA